MNLTCGEWQKDTRSLTMTMKVVVTLKRSTLKGSVSLAFEDIARMNGPYLSHLVDLRLEREKMRLARYHLTVTSDGGGAE